MKLSIIILYLLMVGCACPQVLGRDRKQRAVIYDDKGKVKEHVIVKPFVFQII